MRRFLFSAESYEPYSNDDQTNVLDIFNRGNSDNTVSKKASDEHQDLFKIPSNSDPRNQINHINKRYAVNQRHPSVEMRTGYLIAC
jgi:hypothetical protein